MIRGIQANAQAMNALMLQQDVEAHNLANQNTTGFKRDRVRFELFSQILRGQETLSPKPVVTTERTQGALTRTDNPLDLALQGSGWFSVETPEGVRYTRDGSFKWDAAGRLVDAEGHPVQGASGALKLDPEAPGAVMVGRDGTLTAGSTPLGRLKITHFAPDAPLERGSGGRYAAGDTPAVAGASEVWQGYLESSTVNPVEGMVEMMSTLRLFEANQKAFRVQDESLSRALQELAR
ncbi:MAG TPA: flagellar hook-basal body protein [Elusimicrobiota bacterium]|nr:flagellar hook-basal body protein [Elusimicrobiota bacterium]